MPSHKIVQPGDAFFSCVFNKDIFYKGQDICGFFLATHTVYYLILPSLILFSYFYIKADCALDQLNGILMVDLSVRNTLYLCWSMSK